jgi:hypothetical protein
MDSTGTVQRTARMTRGSKEYPRGLRHTMKKMVMVDTPEHTERIMMMTMLSKKNWNKEEEWYEVPVEMTEAEITELDFDENYVLGGYRRIAWWDKRSKNWISYIANRHGHQVGDAEFFANKRTFVY